MSLFKELGIGKVLQTRLLHESINVGVEYVKDQIGNGEFKELGMQTDRLMGAVAAAGGRRINIDTRTRQDLLEFIAVLELTAAQYRDEIADGQYND